jgi:hypothetical protein
MLILRKNEMTTYQFGITNISTHFFFGSFMTSNFSLSLVPSWKKKRGGMKKRSAFYSFDKKMHQHKLVIFTIA